MQVKLADSEVAAEEKKLFIGMLSRTTTEDYLRQLFSQFGEVEDAAILRNPDGSSKGCGFIKMVNRVDAQTAINSLNNIVTVDVSWHFVFISLPTVCSCCPESCPTILSRARSACWS